jgi:hypothetical protein
VDQIIRIFHIFCVIYPRAFRVITDAKANSMKRSPQQVSKIDILGVQMVLEVAAGGVFTAVLLRWVM